jgi:hypothetical protein
MSDIATRARNRLIKGDGRNYLAEIADRRREFERLKDEAERFIRSGAAPTEVQRALADFDQQAGAIYWRVPVKDYEAEDIIAGQDLADEIRDFQVWLEEQYSAHQINSRHHVDTKDMSTLIEVAKLLGQISLAGAGMYVGAGAARETYDAIKAKCREMMDKLDDAQNQLESIDPKELDAEMRSDQEPREEKGDVIYGMFGSGSEDSGEESGEPGDVAEFFAQSVSEAEGSSTTLENMYEAYVEWCQSRGCAPVPPEAFKREVLGMGIVRQYIAGRDRWLGVTLKSVTIKSAGAHTLYR